MGREVVIVGGVAGGASCAARLRRLDESAHITLVERGPYISFANCGLPYHLSGVIRQRDALLVQTVEGFQDRFAVEVLTRTEATAIHPDRRTILLRRLDRGEEIERSYDTLVLSPGAEPVRPPLRGMDLPQVHVLRTIPDLDRIMDHLRSSSARRVAVIGAGFIGLEVVENLLHRGLRVSLVELERQVMPLLDAEMAAPLARALVAQGVDLRLGIGVESIEPDNAGLSLQLRDGARLAADLVLLAVGVRPEVKLAREAGLTIGPLGGIAVDAQLRTSDPHIFAVGDAIEITHRATGLPTRIPLAGPANRQGRLVADVIVGRDVAYPGALGTSIVKLFNLAAASVGLSEKAARQLGLPHRVAWISAASHASYYPGASLLTAKVIFDPESGRLLGSQIVGPDGADKRIDVLATAMAGRMTVFDLEQLDLAYAPPFSSARDPINHLGTVASGMLRGDHPSLRWDEIEAARERGDLLLDVREPRECRHGTIPGAVNIPLPELRRRLGELPPGRNLVVFCQIGLRGYLATRLLVQHGFSAVNLLGGYRLWTEATLPLS